MNENAITILILTHGRWGEELVRSGEMITGEIENIYAFSLMNDMSPEQFFSHVSDAIEDNEKQYIALTDIYGGTPSNVAVMLSQKIEMTSVSGLNLPMLLEAVLNHQNYSLAELALHLKEIGGEGCKVIGETVSKRNI